MGRAGPTIQADWAAQRIKNLSLGKAIVNALLPRRNQNEVTSLIEEFQYPKHGPGMMWEGCRDKVVEAGTEVGCDRRRADRARRRLGPHGRGRRRRRRERLPATHVISSMPINALVQAMDPPPPAEVLAAADGLRYRDFLTVALVVPERYAFPDNWIYVHAPDVKLGRIQNFGSWSPYMVKDGRTCLGLEYFVYEGDELWDMDDDAGRAGHRGARAARPGRPGVVEAGYVVRMPKAYPVYDATYAANVEMMRAWLAANAPTCTPSAATGCTGTTTRTTRCSPPC